MQHYLWSVYPRIWTGIYGLLLYAPLKTPVFSEKPTYFDKTHLKEHTGQL